MADTEVPAPYRADPLIVGRYYYSLPEDLLQAVVAEVGEPAFRAAALECERVLAAAAGPPAGYHVGWFDGRPLQYGHLDNPPELFASGKGDPSLLGRLAMLLLPAERAKYGRHYRGGGAPQAEQRVNWAHLHTRAYCGWLLTNRQFLQEHDELVRKHLDQVRQLGLFPRLRLDSAMAEAAGFEPADEAEAAYGDALGEFCDRWELSGLAGPYLPIPLLPQVPVPLPLLGQRRWTGGTLIFWPHSAPLPPRDELRSMIEDALGRRRAPDHLREWVEQVGANNPARRKDNRYIRVFVVQHYLRALYLRHPGIFEGNRERLQRAFFAALYPGGRDSTCPDPRTHREDLNLIAERLGSRDWYRDPGVLDVL